jgi:putative oxidoreductase
MKLIKTILFGGRGTASLSGDVMLAVVRVSIGLFMLVGHGWSKLTRVEDGTRVFGPPQMLIDGTAAMGFPAPELFAWCAALTESLGAVLLILGLLTRPAAFGLVFTMGVAAFVDHANDPWFMAQASPGRGSKEMAMLFMFPCLLFLTIGAGKVSADALLYHKSGLKPPMPKPAKA